MTNLQIIKNAAKKHNLTFKSARATINEINFGDLDSKIS